MLDVPLLGWIATIGTILALITLDCSRLCSAMSVYRAVAKLPPAGLNGRRSAQVRHLGGRICLASPSGPGGGREER